MQKKEAKFNKDMEDFKRAETEVKRSQDSIQIRKFTN